MSRIGSILNEELAHQRNGSSFAFVPLRHSQPQVELWPIRSQQPPMRPKEPPNPLSTIFRLHRIFIFSFSFLQGLQSSLLRPSWQNTHPAVQSGASNVLLRNFSKIIPFHRILQRHVHTQQHSKEDPLHDVYPAPDRLDPNRYPNENVNVLYQLLYQNGFHTIYTSKVYHQISQDLLSKDDNEPALPSTNTKNSSPNTSTISLH